jgi:hypothetical protein
MKIIIVKKAVLMPEARSTTASGRCLCPQRPETETHFEIFCKYFPSILEKQNWEKKNLIVMVWKSQLVIRGEFGGKYLQAFSNC